MEPTPRYWFPAKTHGWGWGAPRTWEGWLVLLGYTAVVAGATVLLRGQRALTAVVVVLATALVLWVCREKGEPPRWRWGGR